MASDERRAVAQSDLDALVAACERLYEGLGFDATAWNEALKAVSHSAPLEQVGWQNTKYRDLWLVFDPYIEKQHPVGKGYEPVYRLASARVTEATAPSRED